MNRWNIIDRKDITKIKDSGKVVDYQFNLDKLTLDVSNILTDKKNITSEIGDIIYVADSLNKQIFLGVVNDVVQNTKSFDNILCKEFDEYFDLKVDSFNTAVDLETYVEDIILDNFVNTSDTQLAANYLDITKDTTTFKVPTFDEQYINANEIFIQLFSSFNLQLVYNLDFTTNKINVNISTSTNTSILKTKEVKAVINVNTIKNQNQVINRLDIDDIGVVTFYYLKSDNTITTNAADPLRLLPVKNNVTELQSGQNPLDVAAQELEGNIYNHLIEIEITKNNNVFKPLEQSIGDNIIIYDDEIYDSILTGLKYNKTQSVTMVFGLVRKDLTQVLNKLIRRL